MQRLSNKLMILLCVGLLLLLSGVSFKVRAGEHLQPGDPGNVPGEGLDLLNYLFFDNGSGGTGLGVFLGTYAVGLTHCEVFHLNEDVSPNRLECWEGENSGLKSTTGFGVLYLAYPQQCSMTGYCVVVPQTHIALPTWSDSTQKWTSYLLTEADPTYGHQWGESTDLGSGQMQVQAALGDFDSAGIIF